METPTETQIATPIEMEAEAEVATRRSPVLLEHLFRRQAGRMVSSLAGLLGFEHLQLAEDAVQEAMLRAVQLWPVAGIPEKPEGWLFRVAQNHALTALRRRSCLDGKTEAVIRGMEERAERGAALGMEALGNGDLQDDELRMIFLCCHPALRWEARVALSLKLVGGFGVGEIARIFLADERTIAQRLVRAKRRLRERGLCLELPEAGELAGRLDSVLEAIYLLFTSGYGAGAGQELIRRDVCLEALRLGRLVADSRLGADGNAGPRAQALVALMALQAARLPARTDAAGELVLLEEQDRGLWDRELIGLGFAYFGRSIGGAVLTEWHVQAAIAATYAMAPTAEEIDWQRILEHYDQLVAMTASPVAALNRAVAVMRVRGAAAALEALDELAGRAELRGYHLLPAVRGRVLAELWRFAEAEAAFAEAIRCGCSEPERRFLERCGESARCARSGLAESSFPPMSR